MAKDLYGILGVSKGASDKEIKRAYRKIAQENHLIKIQIIRKPKNALKKQRLLLMCSKILKKDLYMMSLVPMA